MTIIQTKDKPAKVKILFTLPANAEYGEPYSDATNGKLAMRTTEGWKYFTQD